MKPEDIKELFELAESSYHECIKNCEDGEESELPSGLELTDLITYRNKISKVLYKQGEIEKPFYNVMLRLTLGDKAPSFYGAYHIYVRIENHEIFDDYLYWD